MPRRPVSPDPDSKAAGASKDKKDKKPGKKDDGGPESPAPPMDPDEKLLYDGFQSGANALSTIVSFKIIFEFEIKCILFNLIFEL